MLYVIKGAIYRNFHCHVIFVAIKKTKINNLKCNFTLVFSTKNKP